MKVSPRAVTPPAPIVTRPPPPNTPALGSALLQTAFAPAVAEVSQLARVLSHVPVPPFALESVSAPSQYRLCARNGGATPRMPPMVAASSARRSSARAAGRARVPPVASSLATTQADVDVDQTML